MALNNYSQTTMATGVLLPATKVKHITYMNLFEPVKTDLKGYSCSLYTWYRSIQISEWFHIIPYHSIFIHTIPCVWLYHVKSLSSIWLKIRDLTVVLPSLEWWWGFGHSAPKPRLIGGLEYDFWLSRNIGNVIIPTDELIFFRGVGIPPTRRTILVIKMILDGYNMILLKARLDYSTIPKHIIFFRWI